MKKKNLWRFFLLTIAVIMVVSICAVTVSAYSYSNILSNSTPTSKSSWDVSGGYYQKGDYDGEFKADGGKGPVTASQTVTLTARDRIRANNGELTVSGSAYFWAQASCTMSSRIRIIARNSSSSEIMNKLTEYSDYKVKKHNEKVSTSTYKVPANTYYLEFYAKNEDSLAANPPSMRLFVMKLVDSVAPSYVNGYSRTSPGKYKKGTTISYAIRFTEPVNVSSAGTITYKIGSQSFTGTYTGQSSNGCELYYNLPLNETSTRGNNLAVTVTKISGISVTDDYGNSKSVTTTSSLNATNIYLDNKEPEVTSLATSASVGAVYKAGEVITFTANFDEYVWKTGSGSPSITLSNGKTASYVAPATSTDTTAVQFKYTVASGDDTTALGITAVTLTGIQDSLKNNATSAKGYSTSTHNSFLNNYNIKVDTKSPVVTFPETDGNWTKSFSAPLVVTDEIAGVNEVYGLYSTASSYTPTSTNVIGDDYVVPMPKESGIYYIHVLANDNVGNRAVFKSSSTYKFDFTQPVINTVFNTEVEGKILSSVTASFTDEHSDVKSADYKWYDENDVIVLSGDALNGEIQCPTADGEYKIVITATDNAGNTASVERAGLAVDASIPEVTFGDTEQQHQKSQTVEVSVVDKRSAIKEYMYFWSADVDSPSADSEEWIKTTATSFTTPADVAGTYYLHIKATDVCGNTGIYHSEGIAVDNVAPVISIMPNGNANEIGHAEYQVTITVSDTISIASEIGVTYAVTESTLAPVDGYTALDGNTVNIIPDGKDRYLHVKAFDVAGNESNAVSMAFIADIVAPTGSIDKKDDIYYINNNFVTVVADATDDYSSHIEMQFIVDEKELEWEVLGEEKLIEFDKTEGIHTVAVRFRDESGNTSEYTDEIEYYYDVTAPVITLTYSDTEPTKEDVTVTASANDTVCEVTFNTVTEKVFTANGEFEFSAIDEAGNIARVTAKVENIDKTIPEITISSEQFDGKKYKEAEFKITGKDENGISLIEYSVNGSDEFKVAENGIAVLNNDDGVFYITARVTDGVGNVNTSNSANVNLDNTAPIGSVTYTPATRTAQNVTAMFSANEAVTVTNNDAKTSYMFEDNGEFTFEFADEAGNTSTFTAEVTWIDRSKPVGRIAITDSEGNNVDINEWVNYDLCVAIVPPPMSRIDTVYFNGAEVSEAEGIEEISEFNEYVISRDGILSYDIIDTETLVEGHGEVYIRIDKEAPYVDDENISYSITSWTNGNVSARITANDNLSSVTYINGDSFTFTKNGTHTFEFEDEAGNAAVKTVTVSNIDKTSPVATVEYYVDGDKYDTDTYTNKDVTAKITFENDGLSPITITNNGGSDEIVFTDNGSFEFTYADEAGNTGSITAKVSKIDKIAPSGYVTYSYTGWTNKDVIATLTASDDCTGITILNNADAKYTFKENGEFVYEFEDEAGNKATATAKVSKIDKVVPTLSYKLSITETTAFSVYAFVEADESVTYLTNGGKSSRQFNSNGSYLFKAVDRAGNTSEIEVVVSNISKESTPVVIEYSTTEPTNGDVYATIRPLKNGDTIYVINNGTATIKKFTDNGEFVFSYRNAAGVTGEAAAVVSNIDKTIPDVEVTYSHTEITNTDVTATFTSDEDVTYPYYVPLGVFTFTENAKYSIPVSDKVGNINNILIETKFIDKTAPVITIEKTAESIAIGDKFNVLDGVSVSDNVALDGNIEVSGEYDINKEGVYVITYTAKDTAGNIASAEKELSVYDPNKFNVIVNDKVVSGDKIIVKDKKIIMETINSGRFVNVKIENGKKKISYFKNQYNYINLKTTFENNGVYTVYITDSNRNSKLFYLYIME